MLSFRLYDIGFNSMMQHINVLHFHGIIFLGVLLVAADMQKLEMQWMKAIKLSQQTNYAEATQIFKSISWELEELSRTLEKDNGDQGGATNSVLLDASLAYSQTSKLLGLQLQKAGDTIGAINAFKTAVACGRAMLNQRRLNTRDNEYGKSHTTPHHTTPCRTHTH